MEVSIGEGYPDLRRLVLDRRPVPARRCFRAGRGCSASLRPPDTRRTPTSRPPGEPSGRCMQGDVTTTAHRTPRAVPQSSRRWHGLPNPPIGDHDAGGGPFFRRRPASGRRRKAGPARRRNDGTPDGADADGADADGAIDVRIDAGHGCIGAAGCRRRRTDSTARPRASGGARRTRPRRKAAPATLEGRRYMDIHSGSRDWRERSHGRPYHSEAARATTLRSCPHEDHHTVSTGQMSPRIAGVFR
jgi:hypothetical protein